MQYIRGRMVLVGQSEYFNLRIVRIGSKKLDLQIERNALF